MHKEGVSLFSVMPSAGAGPQSFLFLAPLPRACLCCLHPPEAGEWGRRRRWGEAGLFLLAMTDGRFLFSHPGGRLKLTISRGSTFWVHWRHLFWATPHSSCRRGRATVCFIGLTARLRLLGTPGAGDVGRS